jgi:lysozyme
MIDGIDVSHWQGVIDWDAVARAGIRFAFIKATEGATYTDPSFQRNRSEARRAGVLTGAYHYFRSSSEVDKQVENFFRVTGPLVELDLPPVLDVEDPAQWTGKSKLHLTELVLRWLDGVEKGLGIKPLVYVSPSFAESMLDDRCARLGEFPLWVAHWDAVQPRVPLPWTAWTFWQHSSKGKVAGITENVVDLDRFAGTEEALNKLGFAGL